MPPQKIDRGPSLKPVAERVFEATLRSGKEINPPRRLGNHEPGKG